MTIQTKYDPLFGDFPASSPAEWLEKFEADLKGKSPDKFNWHPEEGLEWKPIYFDSELEKLANLDSIHSAPDQFPFLRGSKKSFQTIRQPIYVNTVSEALDLSKRLSYSGVNAFEYAAWLAWEQPSFFESGLGLSDPMELRKFLVELHTKDQEHHFRGGLQAGFFAQQILALLQDGVLENFKGSVDFSPLGSFLRFSNLPADFATQMDFIAPLVQKSRDLNAELGILHAGGELFRESGADLVLESACVLGVAQEYLEGLKSRGIGVLEVARSMHFSFSIGSSYFPEIARLRAFRMLWSGMLQKHGLDDAQNQSALAQINCRGNYFYRSAYDAHTNILRNTSQAMSAIIGGCQSYTASGMDSMTEFSNYNEFSERISRNTQLILKHEAHLNRVHDPAGGSWYIEKMSNDLAEAIWKKFQWIESEGGLWKLIQQGKLQKIISENRVQKMEQVSKRSILVLGTNQYPDARERSPKSLSKCSSRQLEVRLKKTSLAEYFAKPKHDLDDYLSVMYNATDIASIDVLETFRLSQEFEQLRKSIESRYADKPTFPVIFLYTFGDPLMRRARASFSANFFGCAGYEIIDNPGFDSIEQGLKELQAKPHNLIVLCAADEDYKNEAPQILKQLKSQNHLAPVVLAGNPDCIADLKDLGLNDHFHMGSDILKKLNEYDQLILSAQ